MTPNATYAMGRVVQRENSPYPANIRKAATKVITRAPNLFTKKLNGNAGKSIKVKFNYQQEPEEMQRSSCVFAIPICGW